MTASEKTKNQYASNQENVSSSEASMQLSRAQQIFLFAAFGVIIFIIPYFYCLTKMHIWHRDTGTQNTHWIQTSDYFASVAACLAVLCLKFSLIQISYSFFYHYCKEQEIESVRQKRVDKASQNFYKTIYFVGTTVYGYYLLRDIDWFPWYLGGSGDMVAGFKDMPYFTYREGVKWYQLVTMGYHLMELLHHTFIKERHNDFEEMLLHHICTIILFVGCIMINNYVAGCLIIYLHNVTDIGIAFVKMLNETQFNSLTAPFLLLSMLAWFYFRCLCFPHIIYVLHTNWTFDPSLESEGLFVRYAVTIFLTFLVILHFYWLYLMCVVVFQYSSSGQVEDIQNKLKVSQTEKNILQSKNKSSGNNNSLQDYSCGDDKKTD